MKMQWMLLIVLAVFLCPRAFAQEPSAFVLPRLKPGTYILTVPVSGLPSVTPALLVRTTAGPPDADTPPTGIVAASKAAYANIPASAEPEQHAEQLAEGYRALALGVRRGLFRLEIAAQLEDAMVEQETGKHFAAYEDWRRTTRAAVTALAPAGLTAEKLAGAFDAISESLADLEPGNGEAVAAFAEASLSVAGVDVGEALFGDKFDPEKLLRLLAFLIKLFKLFGLGPLGGL